MLDSPRFSRRLAATGLIAAPLLFLASSAFEPSWGDDASTYLAGVAGNESRHAAWAGLFALGSLFLLAGLLGTARLLRGRRGVVGRLGASVLGVSALIVAGLILAIAVTEIAMVDVAADRSEMIALYDRTEDLTFALVVFGALWLGGFVGGTLTLALGLLLRRVVPIWSPLLLVAWMAAAFFLEARWTFVGSLLLLGALAPIAHRIATLSDEEWSRWQPVTSDAPRRPAHTGEIGSSASA